MQPIAYHINHEFLIEQANAGMADRGRLLDFGTGKGDIVLLAMENGWDAHGIEYFGPGSGPNIKAALDGRGLLGKRVREYDGQTIPFDDASFDVVTSNQVFEHVPDLDAALSEIARVLKPGGLLLFTFPHQDAWREGHSNVFFVHWMKPGSRARRLWLYLNRLHGRVRLKGTRSRREWAVFFDRWLVENTFYRTTAEVRRAFRDAGLEVVFNEADYLEFRLGRKRPLGKRPRLPRALENRLTRAYAGLYGFARKASVD